MFSSLSYYKFKLGAYKSFGKNALMNLPMWSNSPKRSPTYMR